jgi:diguanylate cyclase (GGDEF)-like protein
VSDRATTFAHRHQPAAPPAWPAADYAAILASVGETAFTFDPASDAMAFDAHAARLLRVPSTAAVATGAAYTFKVAARDRERRRACLTPPDGVRPSAYRLRYAFHPGGPDLGPPIEIEEEGRWTLPEAAAKPVLRGVIRVLTDRHAEEQALVARADRDGLTGLLTRAKLAERLTAALDGARRTRRPCAFLLAAVDGLGPINETFGLDTGDAVIAGVAREIERHVREGDHVGRHAVNKLGIVLHDCGPGAMRVVADRIAAAVRASSTVARQSGITATVSIGGVSLPDHAGTAEEAALAALAALDEARARRQDGFVAYVPSADADAHRRRQAEIARGVLTAIDERRMILDLQPIVEAQTGRTAHYECLLRMIQPDGSRVSAGEFMPTAEKLGTARPLDRHAQALAIDLLTRYPDVHVCLNVSGLTAGDPEWLLDLDRRTAGRRDLPSRLTVEITETAAILDIAQSQAFVGTLKDMGCRVAIDDFGVGYTNFANLRRLDADLVKIDGSFVRNVCQDRGDQIIVRSMVELARALGMRTVAEWVVDAPTATYLTAVGIDYLQGYHIGRPAAPETFLGPPPP